jgi:hypothetical protein
MLTINITPRAVLLAAVLAIAGFFALYATAALGSSGSVIHGDSDCDTSVNPIDSLKLLRHDAGLEVSQEPGCPEIGSVIGITGLLFANIDTDGSIVSGDATGVTKPFDHIFRVTFEEDVSQCAAIVTPGTNPGGSGGYQTRAFPSTVVGFENENTVRVGFLDKDNNGLSTDFHLVVVC